MCLSARYQAIDVLLSSGAGGRPAGTASTASVTLNAFYRALRCALPGHVTSGSSAKHCPDCLHCVSDLASIESPLLADLADQVGEHRQQYHLLNKAVIDNPPMLIRDGGVIAAGYDEELDDLRAIAENADQYLVDLELREKERTGIATLKLGYNRVHGYYIEISKAQADKAPVEYVRRQTLKAAERYITPELKEFEDKVLGARERALTREKFLYEQLLDLLHECWANCSFRRAASPNSTCSPVSPNAPRHSRLTQPEISRRPCIEIEGGRHLVVEQVIETPFIANDVRSTKRHACS